MTDTSPVLTEVVGDGILVVTLNRPDARNAINTEVSALIAAALDRLDDESELRVGVIAGNGPAFCAGMDLKAFARGEEMVFGPRGFAGIVKQPATKPLIAVVDGPAMGGGFEVVLACDLIVASERARFGLPEVKRGLTASGGGLFRLPHRIPYHQAMELILSGEPIEPARALELGLINRLTPAGEALPAALELAAVVAANAPLAAAASKRVVRESVDWPVHEVFDRQEPIVDPVRKSADAAEGAKAFGEKRTPRWVGA